MTLPLINDYLLVADLIVYHHVNFLSNLCVISLGSLDSHFQLRLKELYLGSEWCTALLDIIECSQIQILLVGLQVGEQVVPLIISNVLNFFIIIDHSIH